MVFAGISFLSYFLPAVLVLYYLVPFRYKNLVLLAASQLFYFYGEPLYSLLMILSSLSGYLHGIWIDKARTGRYAKLPLISSVFSSIGVLLFFKYTDFFIVNLNWVFHSNIPLLRITLPIGISFYTFQILSYTIDVYRGDTKVQKNFFSFALYVSFFPQLIAGPIVRYTDIEREITERSHSVADFACGVNRFVIGLAKKVLLANTLGELVSVFQDTNEKTVLFYWIAALAFMLQIYFDFSGYSDMAIGMGRMFGFHFLENFNYPFISKSLTEFWRRWHMSLGTWFRDYVYIPMGGNRVPKAKWVRNIFAVWFLTGFWHGAQWNFIIWGLYFAIMLVLEKYLLKRILEKLPVIARHIYMLFFVLISFVLFNADGMSESLANFTGMFGFLDVPFVNDFTLYYLKSYGFVLGIAAVASTPVAAGLIKRLSERDTGRRIVNTVEPAALVALLIMVTGYLIDGSFNPFLYFRF